jgi:hypothetical protein
LTDLPSFFQQSQSQSLLFFIELLRPPELDPKAGRYSSGFTSSLYEFVSSCQELSLVPLKELINGALR